MAPQKGWIGRLKEDTGAAMAATLGMILLNLIVSATLVALVMNEYQTAALAEESRQAFHLAKAAARRIEVLLSKITGADFTAYSASDINVGAGGGGNGVFTLHGALYVANCSNVVVGGQTYCVGLNLQGNGAILNDQPFIGDTPGIEPYHNRVYVQGYLTGQGNSWQIGLDVQKMWGVHAAGWPASYENQIDAYRRDDAVPIIPFADPSQLIADQKANASNELVAYVCTRPAGVCTPGQWDQVDLNNLNGTLTLENNAKVLIPDKD